MLASCVVDAKHQQIYTAEQWEEFGGVYAERALALWEVAKRLSGLGGDDAKK